MKRGLWIIGFRAAGKTTAARLLAPQLGLQYLDLDEEWESRAGTSILDFVEKQGIENFRREEASLLAETQRQLERGRALIVATGGGFVDWAASRSVLEQSSFPKLYLNPPIELLWERLETQPDRRKIGHLTSFQEAAALFEKRRPFYEKIASITWKDQDINGCLPALKTRLGL